MKKAGIIAIGVATSATMLAFIFAIPDHISDPSWPPHARNHVFQALFWIVGFCVAQLVLLIPLHAGRRWAFWGLAACGVFTYGGYFVPVVVTGGGAPGPRDDVFFSVVALVFFGGLVVDWASGE